MATSVSQFGITLTFDTDYTVGQFVNGDYYIVAPSGLTIETFSPASGTALGWEVAHGAMLNPWAQGMPVKEQGFMKKDSGSFPGLQVSGGEYLPYSASLNVAAGVTPGTPLVVQPDASMVCSISRDSTVVTSTNQSKIDTYAVFTILASAPAAGTFRPGYASNTKDLSFNTSAIDWAKIGQGLAVPTSPIRIGAPTSPPSDTTPPTLAFCERHVERPWIDFVKGWRGGSAHAINNCARWTPSAGYARELANEVSDCALMLLDSNKTTAQKQTLLYGFLQVGIDMWSVLTHDDGTSSGTTSTTITDSTKSWTTNEWAGAKVWTVRSGGTSSVANGAYGTVVSNTATTLTINGWTQIGSGSGTPPSGTYYRVGADYGMWQADGGHGQGRKFPVALVAYMFERSDIEAIVKNSDRYWANAGASSGFIWQEDQSTFYVASTPGYSPAFNYGAPNNPATVGTAHEYGSGDVGMPEWGHGHADPTINRHEFQGVTGPLFNALFSASGQGPSQAQIDAGFSPTDPLLKKPWGDARSIFPDLDGYGGVDGDTYRWCCTANTWTGMALALLAIPGLRTIWNHQAFLDYMERWHEGFGTYHPNSGAAITSLANFTGWTANHRTWHGRGGRSATATQTTVSYDLWQALMWDTHRPSLPFTAPTLAVVQTASAGGAPTDDVTATLPGSGTNGNYLIAFAARVSGVAGDGDLTIASAGWTTITSQTITSETGTAVLCGFRKITSGENSVQVTWDDVGPWENFSVILLEVSIQNASLELVEFIVNDLSGTGTTVPLGSVDASAGDLVLAMAQFHDDDGVTPAFSNDFEIDEEISGDAGAAVPDQHLVVGHKIPSTSGSLSTTLSFGTPPAADERDGLMVVFRDTEADQTIAPTGIASAEAFGSATLSQSIEGDGIASAEGFGTPTMVQRLHPPGIPSAETFGTALVAHIPPEDPETPTPFEIGVTGIPSAEAFGTPALTGGVVVSFPPSQTITLNRKTEVTIDR